MLGFVNLGRFSVKGGLEAHKPVAVGDPGDGIAAVQGFEPVEGMGRGGAPRDLARACGHAVYRYGIGQGKRGHHRHPLAGGVPHFDAVGEAPPGHGMGPRLEQPLHQQILAVGGKLGAGPGAGLGQNPDHISACIDDDQLAGGVIVKEGIVMIGLEQVAGFVSGAGGGFSASENLGPCRNGRRLRRRAARGNTPHQQLLLVRQPAHRRAEEGVDRQSGEFIQLAVHRANPDADVIGQLDGQGETAAVRCPGNSLDFRALRQGERGEGAIIDPDQARRGGSISAVRSIDLGIDPHASQLVHRGGQCGKGRIGGGIHEQQVLAAG